MKAIAYARINGRALANVDAILGRWLPSGRRTGREWVALNPKRVDKHHGSFKVNISSGRWADFAAGVTGGDLVSLAAYLFDLGQAEAAIQLAHMLGIDAHD